MKNKVGKSRSCGILKFMQIKVDELVAHGRLGTASTYRSTLRSFSNFGSPAKFRVKAHR